MIFNADDYEPRMTNFYRDFQDEEIDDEYVDLTSDESIEEVVKELIHNSRRLDGRNISVSVYHADVTLDGTVRTEEEKFAAGTLVQLVSGVGIIKNHIMVA